MKSLSISFSIRIILLVFFPLSIFAQPSNDRCDNPIPIPLAQNAASIIYIDGDTRMTEDATLIQDSFPQVCSGQFFKDDVWFSFTIGDTLPLTCITIQTEVGSINTDLLNPGMAVYYSSCDENEVPIECFSDAPGRRTIRLPPSCLSQNTTYLVRIWSAGNTPEDSGTFRIGAYINDSTPLQSSDIILWQDDFENGMGDWSTNSFTTPDENWRYYQSDEPLLNAFGGDYDLDLTTSLCTGRVGFPGGWYQTFMTGNPDTVPQSVMDYMDLHSDLISPTINLSGVNTPVSLKFDQATRKLTANNDSLHMYISFSYDNGTTWTDTIELNDDLPPNNPQRNTTEEIFLSSDVMNNPNLKIKFTYDMDFYFWMIDNVRLIVRDSSHSICPDSLTVPI